MGMEKYRTFLAAAGEQSFSAAADKLFLSPSAVSKHISALEEELGVPLFARTKSGARLTEQGRLCVPYVQRITEIYRRMLRELEGLHGTECLSLCAIPLQAAMGLPELLGAFRAAYPRLEVRLEERHGVNIAEAVLSGEHELAFAADRYLPLDRLDSLDLGGDDIVAALPAAHPLARQRQIDLAALRDDPFFLLPPATGTYGAYLDLCAAAGFQPAVRMLTEREENILRFVAQGMGVSLLPLRLAQALQIPGVALIPLTGSPRWRSLLVWERGRPLSPVGTVFRDFAAAFYRRRRGRASAAGGVPGPAER